VNPIRQFFEARKHGGNGIWKWNHYFDIYHRHFERFRGQAVHVLEIGIYSGGSLEMWREYFGPACRIYGVDIQPACKAYENDATQVFIGDQSDRGFWERFRREVPALDIVIDDAGHNPDHQAVAMEELLPHLRRGGVYLCEDVTGVSNSFAARVHRTADDLNACHNRLHNEGDDERRIVCAPTPLQAEIDSVHLYPFVCVIEKTPEPRGEMIAPKHGTVWQPFLS